MVAYTSPDCLPYFEGTDSPCLNTGTVCDPSTVWCDLAALLDARFTAWDSVLSRTAGTIPLAQVKQTVPVTFPLSTVDHFPLTWEFVVQDTASMVDLALDPQLIFIRQPGIWVYHFEAVVSTASSSRNLSCQVDTSIPDTAASGRASWIQPVGSPPDNFRGMALWFDVPFLVTEANLADVSAISLRARLIGNASTDFTMYEATATVYWFAEVPS
jgi:hypothetical protein